MIQAHFKWLIMGIIILLNGCTSSPFALQFPRDEGSSQNSTLPTPNIFVPSDVLEALHEASSENISPVPRQPSSQNRHVQIPTTVELDQSQAEKRRIAHKISLQDPNALIQLGTDVGPPFRRPIITTVLSKQPQDTLPEKKVMALRPEAITETSVSHPSRTDDQNLKDKEALLQAKFGHSNRPSTGNEEDCLSNSRLPISDQSHSLKSRYECHQNWFQEKMRVKVAYDQQRWDNSNISRLSEVLQFFNNQNNLASSNGSLNILDQYLKADFDIQHSRSVQHAGLVQPSRPGDIGELAAKVRLHGTQDIFRYWAEFKFTDEKFSKVWNSSPLEKEADEKGGKIGAELNFGGIKPQIEFRQLQDNVEEDSQKPQTKTSTSRFALTFDFPDMPILTLAYEKGRAQKASNAGRSVTQDTDTNSYSANLWYGGSGWEVYATTSQYLMTDKKNNNYRTDYYDHILGGSYTFFDALTITPSLELTQTDYPSDQYSTQQLYGNLGIYYTPPVGDLSFSLYGYYAMDHDSSEWVDNRNMDILFSVEQDLQKWLNLPHKAQKLILKFNHSQYKDHIYSQGNTLEHSILLLLSISP